MIEEKMIKAVLIDDIPSAIEMLRADLNQHCPEVTIIGTADGVVSGAKLLRQLTPEVVFLDIEMQDGSGFDLLEILPEINFKIIFVTASDQHAIKAFRFSAIDYLLKPINVADLQEAVGKVAQIDSREKVEVLLEHWSQQEDQHRIALHTSEEIKIVNIKDIVRCESDNNYTYFHFLNGSKFLVTRTLKSFDILLSPHRFLRVHQSHLVNLNQVRSYMRSEGGYLLMADKSHVPVSVRKKAEVMEILDNK
jgi:two-component system LytT family response regulator